MSMNDSMEEAWASFTKAHALLADAIEEGNGRKKEVAVHHLLVSCVMLLSATTAIYGEMPSAFPRQVPILSLEGSAQPAGDAA